LTCNTGTVATDYDDALALIRGRLFGPAPTPAPAAPPRHVVPHEGQHVTPGHITADQRWRDYTRRLFDADYDAVQQPLPPEEPAL
jgi:hypothetical protein